MIEPHLAKIPYLGMGENEYIYRFRTLKERNTDVYIDKKSQALYQSKLCNSIKAARRIKEKKSSDPAVLDFVWVCKMRLSARMRRLQKIQKSESLCSAN
jgi:4-hydroxy-3-methylbut-2-enyl diphosphate reductase